jgi:uncharacterized membrane protein YkvA (DUF1232 family)
VSAWYWLLASAAAALVVYAVFVAVLIVAGRKETARAMVRFVPDCIVLFRRLLADPRVPRRKKLLLAALIPYLALPFDLVPDFIPIAGYLDDAIIVAFVLRRVLRGSERELIEQHWPGPPESLRLILRLAGYTPHIGSAPEREGPATPLPHPDQRSGVGNPR